MANDKKYNVYIENHDVLDGEPELMRSVDTLDEAWDLVTRDMKAGEEYEEDIPELIHLPACVVKYQKQNIDHHPHVIYDKPEIPLEGFLNDDIIWIGNLNLGCYYVTTRLIGGRGF